MAQTFLFEEQELSFSYYEMFGVYVSAILPPPFTLTVDETYKVIWDGIEYEVTAIFTDYTGVEAVGIGNGTPFGMSGNGEPFVITYTPNSDVSFISLTDTEPNTHTVAIYQGEPDGIVIRDPLGRTVTYGDYKKILINKSSGIKVLYSEGEAVDDVEIDLDFSNGDQIVKAPDGKLVKSAIISQPDTLVPENIVKNVEIAGIVGTAIGVMEEVEVALSMAGGNQIVLPSTEDVGMSKVTVIKPDTLIPENIVKDVNIAGVIGVYEGGGSGGDFDTSDEYLKYFLYKIDGESKQIILYKIFYDVIYKETGSYDVTIPNKIGGYDAVIATEEVT